MCLMKIQILINIYVSITIKTCYETDTNWYQQLHQFKYSNKSNCVFYFNVILNHKFINIESIRFVLISHNFSLIISNDE